MSRQSPNSPPGADEPRADDAATIGSGSEGESRSGAGPRLQQLIVTICAMHARGDSAPLAVAELIRLLDALEVDEAAARSALSRLKKRGVLLSTRKGSSAAYQLNPAM